MGSHVVFAECQIGPDGAAVFIQAQREGRYSSHVLGHFPNCTQVLSSLDFSLMENAVSTWSRTQHLPGCFPEQMGGGSISQPPYGVRGAVLHHYVLPSLPSLSLCQRQAGGCCDGEIVPLQSHT